MKLLLATDGLDAAGHALQVVSALVDPAAVEVTVLAVAPVEVRLPEYGAVPLDDLPERRSRAGGVVDTAVSRLMAAGFTASGQVADGHPGEQIVTAAGRGGHGITVVGAGSRSWLDTILLGSCSSYVLHNSPSSVMIVHEHRPKQASETRRVLVATDGSAGSLLAVQTVAEIVDARKAAVRVVAVAEPPTPAFLPVPGATPSSDQRALDLDEGVAERAGRYARAAADTLTEAGLTADFEVQSGHPVPRLLKEVENGAYDLVALGSRGLGPVRRTLLGSVSDQVARFSPAALVARRPD